MTDLQKDRAGYHKERFEEWCKLIEDHKLQDLFEPVPEYLGFRFKLDDFHEGIECGFVIEYGAPRYVKVLFMYAMMALETTKKADKIYADARFDLGELGYDVIVKPFPQ